MRLLLLCALAVLVGGCGAVSGGDRPDEPATLVLEDIDLIAEERTMPHSHPQLYELLDQMDGLHEDADVMLLLTTNRPEILEPALASRPGRVQKGILLGRGRSVVAKPVR